MKRLAGCLILILFITLFGASCSDQADVKYADKTSDQVMDDEGDPAQAKDQESFLFRCGDTYLTCTYEEPGWILFEGEIPEKLKLEDGMFGVIKITEAKNTSHSVPYVTMACTGLLKICKSEQELDASPWVYYSTTNEYVITYQRPKYYVYLNDKPFGAFDSFSAAEEAMHANDAD